MRRRLTTAPPYKNRQISVPCDEAEHELIARAATIKRMPIATWLRLTGLAAAEKVVAKSQQTA